MIRKLLTPLLLFAFSFAHAETIKTDVLVIGGGASGVAAAIQAARSKVKTLLVEPGPWLGGSMTMGGMCVLDANRNLPSGIWGEFRRRVTDYYRPRLGYDTTHNSILRFEPYTAAGILKKMTDTVKNLTVKLNTPWTGIKKDGTGWEVTITVNGEILKVDAKIVIDGTDTGEVAAKAGAQFDEATENIIWIAILKDFGRNANKNIPKPEGYDPALYAWLKGKDTRQMLKDASIPNDKYMINWLGSDKPKPGTGDELYKSARLRTLGLVYYLQTESGYKNLGLDDQFGTPDHLPPMPYVIECKLTKGAVKMVLDDIYKPYDRESKLYRTSIAVGDAVPAGIAEKPFPAYSIPLGSVVLKDVDNLLITEKALSVSKDVNASTANPSVQMTLGQGVGAIAAYCAFFKTTTRHLSVRVIQGEILDYKGYLLPFTDIPQKSHYFRAIQQVCATGLLRGIQKTNGNNIEIHFEPDDIVKTEEIQPTLTEIYTRGFLWFNKEKPGAQFTLGNLLSLISDYTLTDPKTLQLYVQKFWATQFGLTGSFDLNRPVTRLEFAVLANRYLNPFAKTVDLSGRIVN
ncbi:FAD-dependent oxidoreductase [Mucilaginibacter sp. McL0603]|uniref:FAD-dependent oxidoreductase n=1 Tax=Mucilaginibacter sp. McL0603 TaxID=3415670 RepID=UPI003CFAC9F8